MRLRANHRTELRLLKDFARPISPLSNRKISACRILFAHYVRAGIFLHMPLDSPYSRSWSERIGIAKAVVKNTFAALPDALKTQAQQLPVTFEARPTAEMIEDGIEADTLGLFLGEAYPDMEFNPDPLPPQVMLFLDNIWEFCEEDESAYRQEVRTTLLHELGHYLGLDESDLEARGLE